MTGFGFRRRSFRRQQDNVWISSWTLCRSNRTRDLPSIKCCSMNGYDRQAILRLQGRGRCAQVWSWMFQKSLTSPSSRTLTQADKWDKEASLDWENNDVHSSQNTYGSRSTIRPFINEKPKRSSRTIPPSLRTEKGDQLGQNTMNPARPPGNDSNSFVERAPVQNAKSVPSRPATQQRQSHPQPAAPATYPSKVRDTIKKLFSRHNPRSPSAPSTSTAYRNEPSFRDYSSSPSALPASTTHGHNQSPGEYPRSRATLPTRHGDGCVRDTYGHKKIDPWLTCLTCKRRFESREDLFNHLLAQEERGDGHARDIRTRRPERFVPEIFVFVR